MAAAGDAGTRGRRPAPGGSNLRCAVLITLAVGWGAVLWLLAQTDQVPTGKDRATLRADAVKTGATIALATVQPLPATSDDGPALVVDNPLDEGLIAGFLFGYRHRTHAAYLADLRDFHAATIDADR
jgi:hypothetical protein